MVQIGKRGSISDAGSYDFARAAGIRIVFSEEFAARGMDSVMAEARSIVENSPTYVSFDIDAIAPGTGTPEIDDITTQEARQMIRFLADLVESRPRLTRQGHGAHRRNPAVRAALRDVAGCRRRAVTAHPPSALPGASPSIAAYHDASAREEIPSLR